MRYLQNFNSSSFCNILQIRLVSCWNAKKHNHTTIVKEPYYYLLIVTSASLDYLYWYLHAEVLIEIADVNCKKFQSKWNCIYHPELKFLICGSLYEWKRVLRPCQRIVKSLSEQQPPTGYYEGR